MSPSQPPLASLGNELRERAARRSLRGDELRPAPAVGSPATRVPPVPLGLGRRAGSSSRIRIVEGGPDDAQGLFSMDNRSYPGTLVQLPRGTVLTECRSDHVGLWSVVREVREVFPDAGEEEVREITLAIVFELLERRLVRAGFPSRDGRAFTSWETPPAERALIASTTIGSRFTEIQTSEKSRGSQQSRRTAPAKDQDDRRRC